MNKDQEQSLSKPTDNDISKICNEINQLMDQRFALSNISITIFIAFIAWMIPKDINAGGNTVFYHIGGLFLCVMVFFIYGISRNLHKSVRLFTTYLVATKSSNWEIHFMKYRELHGANTGIINVFAYTYSSMCFLSALVPLILDLYYKITNINIDMPFFWIGNLSVGLILSITILYLELKHIEDGEDKILQNWNETIRTFKRTSNS